MSRKRLEPDGTGVIYVIRCEPTGRVYVGQAQSERLQLRWDRHRSDLRKGKHHAIKLQRAWDKYGEVAFEFLVVEQGVPVGELTAREQAAIDSLAAYTVGLNCTPFAACTRGVTPSPETLAKRSAALKGRGLGRIVSEETKAKIRAKRALQVITPESRAKAGASLRGRVVGPNPLKGRPKGTPVPQEVRAKISATLTGRVLSEEARQHMREAQARPEVRAKCPKTRPLEQCEKLSKIHKTRYAAGAVHPRSGKTHSPESKQRMREAALRRKDRQPLEEP